MGAMLESFASATGAGATQQIVLVADQAGCHTCPKLIVSQGIQIVYLPSHTPELQPTDRLWPYYDSGVAIGYYGLDFFVRPIEIKLLERTGLIPTAQRV